MMIPTGKKKVSSFVSTVVLCVEIQNRTTPPFET